MILDLCRWWRRDLDWWEALPGERQALYLADYRLESRARARARRMAQAGGRRG